MLFTEVLNSNKDFLRLYKKGHFVSCDFVVVYFLENRLPFNRLGITTGKKIGNAVKRNRARRIIRTAYRNSEEFMPIGLDIVIVAREKIDGIKSDEIESFFKKRAVNAINKSISKNGRINEKNSNSNR